VVRKGVSTVLALLIVLCFSSFAFAAHLPRLDGKPAAFKAGDSQGYFIWQDKEGLHVRTTTLGKSHVFSGVIRTDGVFEDTFGKTNGQDDYFHVNGDRNKITFQFTTTGGTSGIDMHFKDGTYLTFSLSMDGDEINPNDIFIGEDGWHPESYKFTIRHGREFDRHDDGGPIVIIGGPWIDWGPGPGPGPHRHGW